MSVSLSRANCQQSWSNSKETMTCHKAVYTISTGIMQFTFKLKNPKRSHLPLKPQIPRACLILLKSERTPQPPFLEEFLWLPVHQRRLYEAVFYIFPHFYVACTAKTGVTISLEPYHGSTNSVLTIHKMINTSNTHFYFI